MRCKKYRILNVIIFQSCYIVHLESSRLTESWILFSCTKNPILVSCYLSWKIFLGRSLDTQLDVGYLSTWLSCFNAPNFVFRLILTTKSFCSSQVRCREDASRGPSKQAVHTDRKWEIWSVCSYSSDDSHQVDDKVRPKVRKLLHTFSCDQDLLRSFVKSVHLIPLTQAKWMTTQNSDVVF